jgi:hypothetical protein
MGSIDLYNLIRVLRLARRVWIRMLTILKTRQHQYICIAGEHERGTKNLRHLHRTGNQVQIGSMRQLEASGRTQDAQLNTSSVL